MSYEIRWEEKGVYRRYFGYTSFEELSHSVVEVEHDQRFDEIRYVINDFLASTEVTWTDDSIVELSAVDGAAERSNPNVRVAIVADKPEIRAVGEAYIAAGMNTYPTRLFFSLDEARRWAMEEHSMAQTPAWRVGKMG